MFRDDLLSEALASTDEQGIRLARQRATVEKIQAHLVESRAERASDEAGRDGLYELSHSSTRQYVVFTTPQLGRAHAAQDHLYHSAHILSSTEWRTDGTIEVRVASLDAREATATLFEGGYV